MSDPAGPNGEVSALSMMMIECAEEALSANEHGDALDYITAVAESDDHSLIQGYLIVVVIGAISGLGLISVPAPLTDWTKGFRERIAKGSYSTIPSRALDIASLERRIALVTWCRCLEKSPPRWLAFLQLREWWGARRAAQAITRELAKEVLRDHQVRGTLQLTKEFLWDVAPVATVVSLWVAGIGVAGFLLEAALRELLQHREILSDIFSSHWDLLVSAVAAHYAFQWIVRGVYRYLRRKLHDRKFD